jgi:hypothetical protein
MSKLKSWLLAVFAFAALALPAAAQADPGLGSLRLNGTHVAYVALISPTRAIVPAHVLTGALSTYTVVFGGSDRTTTSCSTCVSRTLTLAAKHPSYNGTTYANDVAVIGFSAVTYNTAIQPVTLATAAIPGFGVGSTVVGMGSYSTAIPTKHDVNHTVTAVSGSGCTTTPTVAGETSAVMAYTGKVLGLVNTVNPTTKVHTWTYVYPYYTWIIAQ